MPDASETEDHSSTRATGKGSTGAVKITYYTDPLCCWSWALEPQWRRLRYEYGKQITWRYRMGGMISGWDGFNDPLSSVSRPAQMGPLWLQARHLSGMPIKDQIWIEDPPSSSYPACMAFKAARLQSPKAGEQYLRRLREAVMLECRNIARREVLLELAQALADEQPNCLDVTRFSADFENGEAQRTFREDLQEVRYRDIGRFPTLTLCRQDGHGVLIVGYRPYKALHTALLQVAPDLQPVRPLPSRDEYAAFWGALTDRELAEIDGAQQEADMHHKPSEREAQMSERDDL